MPDLLRVFVYGTLKQGQRNHARFCAGAVAVEPAAVLGQLYYLPQGYPMLVAPAATFLAMGTADPSADLRTQLAHAQHTPKATQFTDECAASLGSLSAWEVIEGEILSFANPAAALPRLDYLEDFSPGSAASSYWRVLLHTHGSASNPVWTYVAPAGNIPASARRIGTRWP